MANEEEQICAHEPCACTVPEGEKYCSDYCRTAGSEEVECLRVRSRTQPVEKGRIIHLPDSPRWKTPKVSVKLETILKRCLASWGSNSDGSLALAMEPTLPS